MTKVVVIGPNTFSGVCMAASLAELPDVAAERCEDPAHYVGDVPDIVLLQDVENPPDHNWLAAWLTQVPHLWPGVLLMVVTGDVMRDSPLCLQSGVRACLPSTATLEALAAAILLIRDGMIVYLMRAILPGRSGDAGSGYSGPGASDGVGKAMDGSNGTVSG